MHYNGRPSAVPAPPAQKVFVIALVAEDLPALDAAHDNMVQGSHRVYSGSTGHTVMHSVSYLFYYIID
jgi:hypothetical protein